MPEARATALTPQFPPRLHGSRTASKRVPRWAVIGIFLILLSGFVIEARSFLMPVTLAFLLFFVFVPFRRMLARVGIGAPATAAIVTVGLIALVAVTGYLVSGPVTRLMADAPQISARLEERFQEIRANLKPLEEAAAKLDEVTNGGESEVTESAGGVAATVDAGDGTATVTAEDRDGAGGTPEEIKVEVTADATAAPSTMDRLTTLGPAVGSQVVFTLVLLHFMLASGDLLYLKIVQSFETMRDKRAAYTALRDIEDKLGAYLGAITWINAGLGAAIGLAMWGWGMPSPMLWALAGFVLNYIPYIGAMLGTVAGVLVALFIFDGIWNPLLVGGTFLALTTLEGQFVTPYFVSRKLELNEVVVFLTVALWAFFWSVLGMVVAVPMLVVLRVLAEHIPGLEKLGNFLAGEPPPALEEEEAPTDDEPPEDVHEAEAREILDAGEDAATAEEAQRLVAEVGDDGNTPDVAATTGGTDPSPNGLPGPRPAPAS